MEKIFKVAGVEKTIENSAVVRKPLDDEEGVYCSLFGYYPKFKCSFSVCVDGRQDRLKKVAELYEILTNDGFETFSAEYSNGRDEEYSYEGPNGRDEEEEEITKEISLNGFITFNDDCLISFGNDWSGIVIMSHKSIDVIKSMIDKYASRYAIPEDKVKCNIIARGHDFYLEEFEIKLKNELDFDLYNEGFDKVNDEIVRSIKEDDNGLYILHGEAGTGKTTYIRHLIKQLRKVKKFVYIPSNLVNDITNPQFISFIMDNKNCVFVVEDCENLVVNKGDKRSSAVADMLNMTDGILADALKIKFICTFNTQEKNIDEALLRPGRCRMRYNFGKLKEERANKAAKKLGLKEPNKDISLAELFAGGNQFIEEKKKIGF